MSGDYTEPGRKAFLHRFIFISRFSLCLPLPELPGIQPSDPGVHRTDPTEQKAGRSQVRHSSKTWGSKLFSIRTTSYILQIKKKQFYKAMNENVLFESLLK